VIYGLVRLISIFCARLLPPGGDAAGAGASANGQSGANNAGGSEGPIREVLGGLEDSSEEGKQQEGSDSYPAAGRDNPNFAAAWEANLHLAPTQLV
jgi:hypothetical protein